MRDDAARFIANWHIDWEAVLEDHLRSIMYLAKTVPGINYDSALNWPAWKVRSRIKHCAYWIDVEEKQNEQAMASVRRGR